MTKVDQFIEQLKQAVDWLGKGKLSLPSEVETWTEGAPAVLLFSTSADTSWYSMENFFPLSTKMQENLGLEFDLWIATITGISVESVILYSNGELL